MLNVAVLVCVLKTKTKIMEVLYVLLIGAESKTLTKATSRKLEAVEMYCIVGEAGSLSDNKEVAKALKARRPQYIHATS